LGYKKPLTEEDMWKLNSENTSQVNAQKLYENLIPGQEKISSPNESRYKTKEKVTNTDFVKHFNGVMWPVIRTYKGVFFVSFILKLITSFVMFANPIILDSMISYISNDEPYWRGFVYASLIFISSMTESLVFNQYDIRIWEVSLRVRSCLFNTIYNKVRV
jgi:hypothetical protein